MNWNKVTLKFKLIGGFFIVLLLLLIVSVVGFYALEHAAKGFGDYRGMALGTNMGGRIQANLLSARMSAVNYINTGSDSNRVEFDKRWKKLIKLQGQAQKIIQQPQWADKIKEVGNSLDVYEKGYKQVIQRINHRNKLVDEVLNKKGPLMENSLTDIMISAKDDGDLTASYYAGLSMKHLLLARLYMAKFLDANNQSAVDRVHEEFKKMINNLDIMDREIENPKRRELLSTVREAQKLYATGFDELVSTIFERNKIIADTLDRIGSAISVTIEDVKLDIKKVQDDIGPKLQASDQKASLSIVVISIVAILVGLSIVFLIIRSVMSQLGSDPAEIAEIAKSIANGNLVIEFDGDDKKNIGVYADMRNMTENLSNMFKDILEGTQTLTSSSTELSVISKQISSNAQQTSEKSNNVSASAEEMSTNMNSVAAATEQTTTNIQTISSAVEEMSATINEIANNTAKGSATTAEAVKTAEHVSGKVNELGNAASEISKVTETIADISEQTNLLALNATIEAARAGEAGKGFAVVAGEIKALAQQTADATNEISSKIVGVQTTTKETVTAIESIVSIIGEINSIVTTVASAIEEQSATTQEISNNVSEAAAGVQEVNENVNQTSAVAGEVTQDITEVSQATEEMNVGSQQINTSAEELSQLAEKLSEMVGQFKI